jgi:SAM-dependent methyltransferase
MAKQSLDDVRRRVPSDWATRVEPCSSTIPIPRNVQEEKFKGFSVSFKWLVSALGREPTAEWTILEAGHGSTGYARYYAQLFDDVYGIDLKDYSTFHPGVTSLVGDLTESIPLPAGSVDLVVSHSVLEHVADVPAVLTTLDQIMRMGAFAFITVYGLYFSAEGAHVRTPELHYKNWEHLDPTSPHYLLEKSPNSKSEKAGHLNGYRFSDYLSAFGLVPWDVVRMSRSYDDRSIPAHVDQQRFNELDLRTRGFKILLRKTR